MVLAAEPPETCFASSASAISCSARNSSISVITDLAMPCSSRKSSETGKMTSTIALPIPATSKRSLMIDPRWRDRHARVISAPMTDYGSARPIGKSRRGRTSGRRRPASARRVCYAAGAGNPCADGAVAPPQEMASLPPPAPPMVEAIPEPPPAPPEPEPPAEMLPAAPARNRHPRPRCPPTRNPCAPPMARPPSSAANPIPSSGAMTGCAVRRSSSSIPKAARIASAMRRRARAGRTMPADPDCSEEPYRAFGRRRARVRADAVSAFLQDRFLDLGRLTRGFRLRRKAAEIGDDAVGTARLARDADVAPVQDQPVMGVKLVLVRHDGFETVLDLARDFAGREAGAISDPEDMRVDRDRGLRRTRHSSRHSRSCVRRRAAPEAPRGRAAPRRRGSRSALLRAR